MLDLLDAALDLFGRLVGAGRQGSHLVGHHRKAAPLLAGPGRLDGGVERQQVGLVGDALDLPITLPIRSDSLASSTAELKASSACLASCSMRCSVWASCLSVCWQRLRASLT